mgnify:CR=1 FL=1
MKSIMAAACAYLLSPLAAKAVEQTPVYVDQRGRRLPDGRPFYRGPLPALPKRPPVRADYPSRQTFRQARRQWQAIVERAQRQARNA